MIPVIVTLLAGATPPPGADWIGGPNWIVLGDPAVLAKHPGVWMAEPDRRLPVATRAWDDPARGGQWYADALGMETLWEVSTGSPALRVAVIDSGIDITHPDLATAVAEPYDALAQDDDPSPPCEDLTAPDCDSHGTSVSGVIAARGNNQVGIVGLCPSCTLVPIRMLGARGGGSLSEILRAFEHAIASDAAVINNSWGFTEHVAVPPQLAEVIRRAATEGRGGKGALVVFAAGNDDRELLNDEMEALPEVLCVSATDSYGYPTNYTNYGDAVDLAAPSATVTIIPGGGTTVTFGGTSAAAPVASGLAIWAASVEPDLTGAELRDLLVDASVPSPLVLDTDGDGHDAYYGYGELDALNVLYALRPDLAPVVDAGAGVDDTATEDAGGGCACTTTPSKPPTGGVGLGWVAALAGLVGFWGGRRRALNRRLLA